MTDGGQGRPEIPSMTPADAGEGRGRFVEILLRPVPHGPDHLGRGPAYRVKRLLKIALRALGLVAVRVGWREEA